MRSLRLRTLAFGLCLPLTQVALAHEPLRPPPAVVPISAADRMLRDGADGQLDQVSLLRGALLASGIEDESQLTAYEVKLRDCVARFREQVTATDSPRDRAALLLRFMHRELLTGVYVADCGNLASSLDGGPYNCVTASVLYSHLATEIGLHSTIWHRTGHVRLQLAEVPDCYVETTSSSWLGIVPRTSNEPVERAIAPPALIGKLYYNQGLQALTRDDHAAAMDAFKRAQALDPLDADAQQNLLATYNNGALSLCDRHEFATALAWLAAARSIDPHYATLLPNELHIEQRWIVRLCEERKFEQALAKLSQGAQHHPDVELYRTGHVAVYRLWAEELVRRGERHAALSKVEYALTLAPADESLLALRKRLV